MRWKRTGWQTHWRRRGVEYYRNLPAFLQGEKDIEMDLVSCGESMPFRLAEDFFKGKTEPVCLSFWDVR